MSSKKDRQSSIQHEEIELFWLGHSGFKIKAPEGVIYMDPYQLHDNCDKADVVFISHSHYDHLDEESIKAITKADTTFFCADDCKSKLAEIASAGNVIPLFPGDEYVFGHLKIKATEAYNEQKKFHPKEKHWLGFLIEFNKTQIYFAGDTDHLKQLESIGCDIGLFPVDGMYTMSPTEAADLANHIKPRIASIPMHWGSLVDEQSRLVGTDDDAEKFCKLCKGPSQILIPI